MRYPKRIANLAHISFTAIFHHACPADDFEIGDLRQLGQDVVLHAIGERRVFFLVAQVFKRKNGDSSRYRMPDLLRPMIPVCRAKIGSCFSQRSKSSASARAEEYRRFGSFSRHFKQIVERSRSIFGFNRRGCRGSVSKRSLIVSYVAPPAKGG